jgi:hypothetical protein
MCLCLRTCAGELLELNIPDPFSLLSRKIFSAFEYPGLSDALVRSAHLRTKIDLRLQCGRVRRTDLRARRLGLCPVPLDITGFYTAREVGSGDPTYEPVGRDSVPSHLMQQDFVQHVRSGQETRPADFAWENSLLATYSLIS